MPAGLSERHSGKPLDPLTVMDYFLRTYLFLAILLFALSAGLIRYRSLNTPDRILILYLAAAWVVESLAFYSVLVKNSNLSVYKVGGAVELLFISLYFNYAVDIFRKGNTGILLGVAGIGIGWINHLLGGAINYFLAYQAMAIVAMALVCITHVSGKFPYREISRRSEFRVSVVFMCYWSIGYVLWTLLKYAGAGQPAFLAGLGVAVFTLNSLANIAIAFIFLFYPKMKRHESNL